MPRTDKSAGRRVVGPVAAAKFKSGYNCAQSILLAFAEVRRVEVPPGMVDACLPMTGGLGRSGCTCGALIGATMLIGLTESQGLIPMRKGKIIDRAGRFHDLFKKRFGSTCCRALRKGIDYDDPALKAHCATLTAATAELLDEYLF